MRKLNVVSLFTGAGGLDYGFEAAGFSTRVAVEVDPDCCATISANRQWPVIPKYIQDTRSNEILETSGLTLGKVDMLIGGPPCQPFSKSGYWVSGDTKRLEDPRADTLSEFMRCVSDLLPEVFVLENVHGINYSGKEEGLLLLERLTRKINGREGTKYKLSWKVLNTADYGIPQVRRRFFLVAHRDGKMFDFPRPTHTLSQADNHLVDEKLLPYVTAWDAIGGMKAKGEDLKVKGRWADLLPSIPEGENYLWHTNRKGGLPLFGWRTRYWSFLLKLAKNQPSWTLQAQPGPAIGPFHWDNRLLSKYEMARLQTFPEDIVFAGSRNSIQKQVGNAVPSLMGEVLAREIAKQLFGVRKPTDLKLNVGLKRPIPPPESTQPVPEKYMCLVGDYPDHPGTGKGKSKSRQIPMFTLYD
jgi:DNA (cytosine-5)-methyltransferase 1